MQACKFVCGETDLRAHRGRGRRARRSRGSRRRRPCLTAPSRSTYFDYKGHRLRGVPGQPRGASRTTRSSCASTRSSSGATTSSTSPRRSCSSPSWRRSRWAGPRARPLTVSRRSRSTADFQAAVDALQGRAVRHHGRRRQAGEPWNPHHRLRAAVRPSSDLYHVPPAHPLAHPLAHPAAYPPPPHSTHPPHRTPPHPTPHLAPQFDDDFYDVPLLDQGARAPPRRGGLARRSTTARPCTARFKLFDSFEGLLERPILQDELEKKYVALVQSCTVST